MAAGRDAGAEHTPGQERDAASTGAVPFPTGAIPMPTGAIPIIRDATGSIAEHPDAPPSEPPATGAIPVVRAHRRAWLAWTVLAVGTFAYTIAVLQRSSFGVVGDLAATRFGVNAAQLSVFVVLQVLAYAVAQIPVGVLLDRFGSRSVLLAGAALMTVGQVVVAVAGGFGGAVAGRVLVGLGDACAFIAVIRVVPAWFPARRVPLLVQVLGLVGQFGQVLSAVPLLWLVTQGGWTLGFLASAATCVVSGILVALAFRDSPVPQPPASRVRLSRVVGDLAATARNPGTQTAFWIHFFTLAPSNVFALLWGVPYIVALGCPKQDAAMLLTLFTIFSAAQAPLLGWLTGIMTERRYLLGIVTGVLTALGWAIVLAWPVTPPFWVLVVMVLLLGFGGPASTIGFDIARTSNPAHAQGAASGLVNTAGFMATLVCLLAVGWLLDLAATWTGAPVYSETTFRIALSSQFVVVVLGIVASGFARRGLAASSMPRRVRRVA